MYVKFQFFPDREPICAIVLGSQEVYFRAADLGQFLGYANPYAFGTRHAKEKNNIAPKIPEGFNNKETILAFTLDEMCETILKTYRYHCVSFEVIARIKKLWLEGYVPNQYPDIPSISQQTAAILPVHDIGEIPIQTWIERYAQMTQDWFMKWRAGRYEKPPMSVDTCPPSMPETWMEDQEKPSMPDQENPSMPDQEKPMYPDQENPSMPDQEKPMYPDQENPSMPDQENPSMPIQSPNPENSTPLDPESMQLTPPPEPLIPHIKNRAWFKLEGCDHAPAQIHFLTTESEILYYPNVIY